MTLRFAPIGDVISKVSSWNPRAVARAGTFRYIDLGAVDNETKIIRAVQEIEFEDAPSRARQLVKRGDILVSTVRPNLNGVAKVDDHFDGATASTGFCVLRPNHSVVAGDYLFQWVKSPLFVADMVRKSTGASYPAVSDRIIAESLFPLPPLDEQRRIAAILDQADELRRKRREAMARIENIANANFIELFGDPLTNSKAWPQDTKLGEIAEIVSGVAKGRRANGPLRPILYLAVANVQDRFLKLDNVKSIEATDEEIARYRLMRDDLLLTEGGDPDKLGRGTLWNDELDECIHQNHIFRVRLTSQKILPIFLNWLVGSPRGKVYFLNSAKQTTGIASINMTQLRNFPLLLPPLDLQRAFAARVAEIDKLKALHRAHLATLDALFASLQHRAFRGEL